MLLFWSGSAATLIVLMLAHVARRRHPGRPDAVRFAAAVVKRSSRGGLGWVAGAGALLVAGSALLPLAYYAVFLAVGRADAQIGALTGVGQGVLAGILLALLPRRDTAVPSPGLFGRHAGASTPLFILLAHALYGAALGYIFVLPG